jgi:hypothetical protein
MVLASPATSRDALQSPFGARLAQFSDLLNFPRDRASNFATSSFGAKSLDSRMSGAEAQ